MIQPYCMIWIKAVEQIEQAVEKQEQITIYGDYDADGIT